MSVLDFFGEEDTRITQLVYDISGSNANDQLGHSISIGLSGEIIAVGAPTSSQGGTERGLVRVYQKLTDLSGVSSWNQMGADLAGTSDNDQFGHSVDLNGDGTILAVGTKDISHNTLIYKYDSGSWGLYGNAIRNNVSYEIPLSEVPLTLKDYLIYNWDFRVSTPSGNTVTDSVGGLTATYVSGVTSSVSDGAYFSGGTSNGSSPYINLQAFPAGGGQSYEIYFKFTADTNWARLIGFGESGGAGGKNQLLARRSTGTSLYWGTPYNGTQIDDGTINNGVWYHIVAIHGASPSGTMTLYVDGVALSTTGSTSSTSLRTHSNYFLGRSNYTNDDTFEGYMKFFRVYNSEL
tara:strand:+ start:94 stop:1140 length:1047 start_codon:yes stop_codon:yes gene_type:complete